MEAKIQSATFLGDITALLRPEEKYEHAVAYEMIKKKLLLLL